MLYNPVVSLWGIICEMCHMPLRYEHWGMWKSILDFLFSKFVWVLSNINFPPFFSVFLFQMNNMRPPIPAAHRPTEAPYTPPSTSSVCRFNHLSFLFFSFLCTKLISNSCSNLCVRWLTHVFPLFLFLVANNSNPDCCRREPNVCGREGQIGNSLVLSVNNLTAWTFCWFC